MNNQTSAAGKAAAAAPARPAATKADAPQNKADKAKGDKGDEADPEKARTLTGSTIVADRQGHSDPSTRAGAGAVEGKFTCMRELVGDRAYASGDARDGKVSDLVHLAQSGAIAPADKATQEALKDYAGVEAAVVKPKRATKADPEEGKEG